MIMIKMKKAFSMVELVFVIVVLGIVASIGASIIAKTYETYIVQKATYNASMKTELAALQIAQRLSYSIPWSIVVKNPANTADYKRLSKLVAGDAGETYTVLEWIGIDNDSFSASTPPGWSGYCDVNTSTTTQCTTHGSKLSDANTTIGNLSGGAVSLGVGGDNPAVFFKYNKFDSNISYAPECVGLVDTNTSCTIPAGSAGDTTLILGGGNKYRAEHYALSWSAYAIVPGAEKDINSDGKLDDVRDLTLYYNYQPWETENYTNDGTSSLLINNVSVFKMNAFANTVRFKLCIKQFVGDDLPITICKEKAVVR
jgi:prepilin-type N-terminal cleavage/methylation domain-containing protein